MEFLSRYKSFPRASSLTFRPSNQTMKNSVKRVFLSSKIICLEPLKNLNLTNEKDPISDINIPDSYIKKMVSQKSLIDLNVFSLEIPKLPNVYSSNFNDIFEQKLIICNQLCNFNDQQINIEMKSDCLTEILDFVSSSDFKYINDTSLKKLIDMVFLNIFRYQQTLQSQFLYIDEPIIILENNWFHLLKIYQILLIILTNFPKNNQLNYNFFLKIISRFEAYDLNERSELVKISLKWISINNPILTGFYSNIMEYLNNFESPQKISPILTVLYEVYNKNIKNYINNYLNFILPLLNSPHLNQFYSQYLLIINLFTPTTNLKQNDIIIKTIKNIIQHFPSSHTIKQVLFLELILNILSRASENDILISMKIIYPLFLKCLFSFNSKLVEISSKLFFKIELNHWFYQNANKIYPELQLKLNFTKPSHWSNIGLENHKKVIESLKKINSTIYRETFIKKNIIINSDKFKNWVLISREAKKNNKTFHLAEKLSELQKIFSI